MLINDKYFFGLLSFVLIFSCATDMFNKKPKVFYQADSKIRSAVLIADGLLYFGNEKCEFYAVNISTGKKVWMYNTDAAVETWPVIADGRIIFNAENSLYILDCKTGDELFKVTHPSKKNIRASKDTWTFNDSYTAVSDGTAYYLTLDGELAAVDINSGSIIWTLPSESTGAAASGVNYDNGKLYYVDITGNMCCVDIEKRQLVFRTNIRDGIYAPIHINNGMLYAGGRSTKFYCIDGNSGEVKWSSSSFVKSTWFSGGSVSIGNIIYAGTSDEHSIALFDKDTGELLRSYPTEMNVFTQPVLNGENIIVISTLNKSYIMEYDTKTHEKLWQAQIEENVHSSPAIYNGKLYFGSDSGKIYSIKLQ